MTARQAAIRLILLSLISLFVELLIIRWLSADIRAFSIFKTFPLVTFYVGLGLGLATDDHKYGRWFPYAMLFFVVLMKIISLSLLNTYVFPSMTTYNWQSIPTSQLGAYLAIFIPLFLLVLSGPLVLALSIGSEIAYVFKELKPLPAYSLNLAGALAGSVLFASLSFAEWPPWALLIIPVIIAALFFEGLKGKRLYYLLMLAGSILIAVTPIKAEADANVGVFWSPYQRIDLIKEQVKINDNEVVNGYYLFSNHMTYQAVWDLTPQRLRDWNKRKQIQWSHAQEVLQWGQARWMLPFQLLPNTDDVLIVASGMGGDVAQALEYGEKSITAVDIDPVIIRLGKQLNPLKPYSNPRVNIVCDDARHYFSRCAKKYDLIVFSHLDSHTVLGTGSAIRLDNFIYTKESLTKALSLLKPHGIMVLSFFTSKDWFEQRLYNTIASAAGYPPIVLKHQRYEQFNDYLPDTAFVLGQPVKDGTFQLSDEVKNNFVAIKLPNSPERTLTDDWPYLYLANNQIDLSYLLVVAVITGLATYFSRKLLLKPAPAVHWQLFFMGAAFMLMELQFISRLALLFGSTWITTSVVINGVLILILGATGIVSKWPNACYARLPLLFALLFLSLVGSYLLPVNTILTEWQNVEWLSYTIICGLTFLPVFLAALIFGASFNTVTNSSRALAFNILGAVVGSLFEYISNYTGVNALLLAVIVFYALAFACAQRALKTTQ